jgi:hypothetical protein
LIVISALHQTVKPLWTFLKEHSFQRWQAQRLVSGADGGFEY